MVITERNQLWADRANKDSVRLRQITADVLSERYGPGFSAEHLPLVTYVDNKDTQRAYMQGGCVVRLSDLGVAGLSNERSIEVHPFDIAREVDKLNHKMQYEVDDQIMDAEYKLMARYLLVSSMISGYFETEHVNQLVETIISKANTEINRDSIG